MAPRAMWTGQLRLSLVSFGVRMYAATESGKRVSMNQLHRDCHQRVRNQLTCPTHGPIGRDEIVKGYEYEKDTYVIIEPDDLQAIKLETTKVIDIVQFVDEGEIKPLFINQPYYLGPDGPVAEEPYRVIRAALENTGKIAIGKLVMSGREQVVAIKVDGDGFLMNTLRYAAEVREGEQFFKEISDGDLEQEQIDLAENIIKSKTKKFDPQAFTDDYREAFFDLVKAKVEGAEPVTIDDAAEPQAFNFIDALKESVARVEAEQSAAGSSGTKRKKSTPKKPAAKSVSSKKKSSGKKQKRA